MSYLTSDQLLAKLRREVKEITVHQLAEQLERGEVTLVDIREQGEWDQGHIKGAAFIPRGYLELQIETRAPDRTKPVAVICAGGVRSLLGARDLETMGYQDVVSVAGGFNGWKKAGDALEGPRTLKNEQR
ncbi:MAG TPA: rhodanese-like domain-containing protein, partial [Anaerolineae bacterium]|nr:rhodanese-like domain-containing protein [Anaerolineae bacterium]